MKSRFAVMFLAVAVQGCAQADPANPELVRSRASGMLELPLGQKFSGPLGDPDTGPIGGTAYYQLPMTGSLVTTFYDFTVEIETKSQKLISVSARRKFPGFEACKKHMAQVTQALSAKYGFEVLKQEAYSFDKTSGPIRAAVNCSTGSAFVNATLFVRVSDRVLSQASEKRINDHFDSRDSKAASTSSQP